MIYRAVIVRSGGRNSRKRGFVLKLVAFQMLVLFAPKVAFAQSDEVLTPVQMFDPDSGEGVRVSPGFILYPQATAEMSYDTNVYNVDVNKTDDAIFSFRPSFVLRSDFSRHEIVVAAGGDIRRYADTSAENSEQYYFDATTLMDLGYDLDVEAYAGFARGIERRGTIGDVFFTDEPVAYHDKKAALEIARRGHRFELGLRASILKRDYSDTVIGGVPFDLFTRDVILRNLRVRADYGIGERGKVFLEVAGNEVDYQADLIPPLDSRGYAILAGYSQELTSLIELEVGAGYIHQNFSNPLLNSVGAANYRVAISWTPKPEWRVTASGGRSVDPSRSQESPAIISSNFTLGAQRAVGDRLLLGAEAGFVQEDYRATPRKDDRFFVSGSATYRLTDRIGVIASAGYRDQDGGDFGRSYKGFAGSLALRAHW